MARCFVEDDDEFFRVTTFDSERKVVEKLGPYDTYGKAKSQGTRLTGDGWWSSDRAKTFTVQKLTAYSVSVPFNIEGTDEWGYEFVGRMNWVDVDG
jgi:hypothetical protein